MSQVSVSFNEASAAASGLHVNASSLADKLRASSCWQTRSSS